MTEYENPLTGSDAARAEIWEILVARDIAAFATEDWDAIAADFDAENFEGLHAYESANPDDWRLAYPDLGSYHAAWLASARNAGAKRHLVSVEDALFDATELSRIEIEKDRAIAYKKFDGWLRPAGEAHIRLEWQSVYRLRRVEASWKIVGFLGYLPLRNARPGSGGAALKQKPGGATQHATAGPYSPVLQVRASNVVVISGQAAIGPSGDVIGENIEDQTHATMANCVERLGNAGCTLADVFKVNVYMSDLAEWQRFNTIYREYLSDPAPVRTAVQAVLLPGLRVEVEMWAATGRSLAGA